MNNQNNSKKLSSLTPLLKGEISWFRGLLSNNFIINTLKDFKFNESIANIITSDLIEYKYCINIKFYFNDIEKQTEQSDKGKNRMSDIKEIKELMIGLIKKVDDINQKVDNLEQRMDRLEHRMDKLEHRMDKLEQKVDSIADDVSILKKNVIRLNNKVFDKNELF